MDRRPPPTPLPQTPITPLHAKNVNNNDIGDVLENFDFDAFLQEDGADLNLEAAEPGAGANDLVAADATISRDMTDGKVAQDLALFQALGAKLGVHYMQTDDARTQQGLPLANRLQQMLMMQQPPMQQRMKSQALQSKRREQLPRAAPEMSYKHQRQGTISAGPGQSLELKDFDIEGSSNEADHDDFSQAEDDQILPFVSSACREELLGSTERLDKVSSITSPYASLTENHKEAQSEDNSAQSSNESNNENILSPTDGSSLKKLGFSRSFERQEQQPLSKKRKLDGFEAKPSRPPSSGERLFQSWRTKSASREEYFDHAGDDLHRQNVLLKQEYLRMRQRLHNLQKPTMQFLHRVNCSRRSGDTAVTADKPLAFGSSSHLTGQRSIPDLDIYIAEKRSNLAFVVFKNYTCCTEDESFHYEDDSVLIVSNEFAQYLNDLTDELRKPKGFFPDFEADHEFDGPFCWYYHCLPELIAQIAKLSTKERTHIDLFHNYIRQDFGHLYKTVTTQIRDKAISRETLPFLYTPGTVVLWQEGHLERTGELTSWPGGFGRHTHLTLCQWSFDGYFCKTEFPRTFDLDKPFRKNDKEVQLIAINDLPCFPIRFAPAEVQQKRRKAGQVFWKSRRRRLVTYNGWDSRHDEWDVNARYMIDLQTYFKMYPDKMPGTRLRDELGPEAIASEDPPGGSFVLLLPTNLRGFSLAEKTWKELDVNGISDVEWNNEAFDSLVVDDDTKVMITALITNKIDADKSTDLIKGKGSGLMILLHGGPGTGKTLTAESVAEIAKKPLYRVTCGDIGTDPDSVEKYLNTVLLLGKTWDCVVLLDEADVFLEQRTLTDLQRNALVSVFLRVLEYYDGILVLTSNRVGTFDEAFKSRIQLALHYESLNEEQRCKIWGNFIRRLESLEESEPDEAAEGGSAVQRKKSLGVDTASLWKHDRDLAKCELNGREIRNAVTTARQLAMYKGKRMDYSDVKHVIGVIGKFNRYLLNINEGTSDAQIMREDHVR